MDSLERTTVTSPMTPTTPAASCCSMRDVIRSWMRDRRVLIVVGLAVVAGGLALDWGWLSAIGIAPLIVSVAPCLLMCALGLCMRGYGPSSGSPEIATGEYPQSESTR